MKYICCKCNKEFDKTFEQQQGIKFESKLVRSMIKTCPFCKSTNTLLTEHGKLLMERKIKLNKIENQSN